MVTATPRAVVPAAKATTAVCSRLSDLLAQAAEQRIWGKVTIEVQFEDGQMKLVHATSHETIKASAMT